MLSLGIWSFGSDSSAVLLDDSSIVSAIEEEKLSRATGAGGIPRLAITRCLEQAGVRLSDVQVAALPARLLTRALRESRFHLFLHFSPLPASHSTRTLGPPSRTT